MFKNNDRPGSLVSAIRLWAQSRAWMLQILGLALAYLITGKLGTFLAIPPGYATAIWPPSGIALAYLLIHGYRVWPGILLGSFLVNLSTSLISGPPAETFVSVAVTLIIGTGASLQALTGTYLVHRYAGYPNSLVREKEVFLLFFFGGILSSLVNSTIAVSTLVAAGRMPSANFLNNWATWWMGDALGIFIFTPLALAWAQRRNEAWRNRQLAITLPIIVLFLLTTTAVFYEAQSNNERLKREFLLQASELGVALEKSVLIHLNVLRSLGSFFSASDNVDRNKFRIFVEHSLKNFNGIQALSWDPRILLSEREAYEHSLRDEGYPNFQIIEKNTDNQIVRASNRPMYIPVGFVEPFQGNESALGFDIYSDQVRREAIDMATDSAEIAATTPVILLQEHENLPGIITYLPVYRKGLPYQSLEQRRNNISGYVAAVFRGKDIVTAALKDVNQKGLVYRVIDEKADQLIFSNNREPLKPLILQENGLFGRNFSLTNSLSIPVGGRSWRIDVVPTQDYLAFHKSNNAWLILLGGLLLTSMVSSFVLVFSGRGNMLRRLVDERTAALAQSEERFRSTFESAPVGVVNSSLDGRFLEVNQGYCDLVGYSRDELITMTFRQVTHPDYRQYDADMVRRMLAGEISGFSTEKKYLRKDGGVVWGNLSVRLIRNEDGSPNYFVAVVENINRRKQAEAQTAKSLSMLYATFESSNDGILVVDLNYKWVLHNQRLIDLWQLPNEIIAAKDDKAVLAYVTDQLIDPDAFLTKVHQLYAAPENIAFDILNFKDGKIIERYSVPQRIDGQVVGRVLSFRDITERKRAEQSLQRESEKNLALLRNASDGIHILDSDGNIIEISDSFCAMLGYRREEMIGMNVTQWDANFTPDQCVKLVKEQFSKQQHSLFETRHRRKDGALINVEVTGHPLELDGKRVLFNSSRDITARKTAEESLRKLSLAVEQSPNSVVITNLNANIEYVNETFIRMTGYSRDEVIGKTPRLLHSGKTGKATYEQMWATLNAGEVWKGELTNRRKDGSEYIGSALISPVRQENGKITHFVGIQEDITAKKHAESLLQESEKRFRNVADAAPVLIWLADTNKRCTWFNQVWLDFTGRSMEQELGNGWSENIHPADLAQCMDIYTSHFERREPFQMEYRLKRYNGEYRWLHNNGVPRFDADGSFLGYIGSCIDITDRKLAEQKLTAQNLRYQTLLKSSTDGIHIIDLNGNIVDMNEAFCKQLGYSYAETMQLNITQWDAQWSAEQLFNLLKELIHSGQAKQFETKHRRKDGSIIDIEINSVPVVVDGQSLLFASARDITERKQNEAVILLAKDRAEALARSKSEFLANMSHEIRTPMNAIIGLTHLALHKEVSPEIHDYLEKIGTSSNSLLSILNDILDFSKLEAGRLTIEHSPFDLDHILNNLHNLFADPALGKGLDLTIETAADVPRHLVGDSLRLQQVLINLLSNAIKFTERGQVRLTINTVQLDLSQARLSFCVTDTGIGMSGQDREKLFLPFSQVDGSITRRFGGTGLGLVISHNLLQLMGGEFAVSSEPGQGSSFSFELMLDLSSLPGRQQPEGILPLPDELAKTLAGARVLIAEDNPVNQQVVYELLKLSGITAEIANDGQEALALLQQRDFDAVLMDIHMPVMDGFEATKLIRSQQRFATLPIIALTAGVTKEERERCMASGMNGFIAKPIKPKKLLLTLMQWIKPDKTTETAALRPDATQPLTAVALPGFNFDNLLEMIGNNQHLAVQLLHTFRDSMLHLPAEIEARIADGDPVSASVLLHKLKGASGTVGAMQLFADADALETELKQGLPATTIGHFKQTFDQAMSAIASLIESVDAQPAIAGDRQEFARIAAELDRMLKDSDFIPEATLNSLKPHIDSARQDLFNQLHNLVNNLHYDEARKLLRKIAQLPDIQEM
jgi:PAS domain S-box-containing protein